MDCLAHHFSFLNITNIAHMACGDVCYLLSVWDHPAFTTQANVTIKATELMGKRHDALEGSGYTGHELEQLLVRLLFCLFADDTGFFSPRTFSCH